MVTSRNSDRGEIDVRVPDCIPSITSTARPFSGDLGCGQLSRLSRSD